MLVNKLVDLVLVGLGEEHSFHGCATLQSSWIHHFHYDVLMWSSKGPILHAYCRLLDRMNQLINSVSPHFQSDHQEAPLQLFSVALTSSKGMFQMLMLPWVMHRASSSWHFTTELRAKEELLVYWNVKKLFRQMWNYSCCICLVF